MTVEAVGEGKGPGKWVKKNVLVGVNPDTGRKYFESRKVWQPAAPKKPGFLSRVFQRDNGGLAQPTTLVSTTTSETIDPNNPIHKRDAARHAYELDKYNE